MKTRPPERYARFDTAYGPLHLFMANDRARVRFLFAENPVRPPREWFILAPDDCSSNAAIRSAAHDILAFVLPAHGKVTP